MTKLNKDEEVAMSILGKICKTLNVDYGDIMEYNNPLINCSV